MLTVSKDGVTLQQERKEQVTVAATNSSDDIEAAVNEEYN